MNNRLEGHRSIATALPLLMALGCKPVPPSPVTDIASGVLADARTALVRCDAVTPFDGATIWEIDHNPDTMGPYGDVVLCEDTDRRPDGKANHAHFDGAFGKDWYLTEDGVECTFPVQLGCGPCQLVDDGDGK